MIVSHKHKFIFLKTKKTAGTSIELALSRICGDDDILSPLAQREELLRTERGAQNWRLHGWWGSPRPLWKRRWFRFTAQDYGFYNHMLAAEVRALIDEKVWRSYFKFAFDRNPWDRQVSFYHQRFRRRPTPPPFDAFLRYDRHARLNNYDTYSLDGEVCIDFVGRYENLKQDFNHMLRQVGVRDELELPHVKSFTPVRVPYQSYYTDATRDIVGDWYSREIALLNYSF
jgi:Sulfotransferase family